MNLFEWLLWYAFLPNTVSYLYMILYSIYDPPDKRNIPHFKKSLLITTRNLFIMPLILALPQLYDRNFIYKDMFTVCNEKLIYLPFEIYVKSFIGSFVFYLCHRLSHHAWFYEIIHKHHHRYTIVEPVSAFDVTVLEFILVYMPAGIISHQLSPYIFYGSSCTPFISDITSRILEMLLSMHIHLKNIHRYDPLKYWPLYNTGTHVIHHKKLNYNYSAPNNYLPDKLFGTFLK